MIPAWKNVANVSPQGGLATRGMRVVARFKKKVRAKVIFPGISLQVMPRQQQEEKNNDHQMMIMIGDNISIEGGRLF